jgi:hypothetical protein
MRIGVVGYSAQKFDEQKAEALLIKAFHSVENIHKVALTDLWIVSGLTNLGVPAVAYRCAAMHWQAKTMGIACHKASNYECYPVDAKFLVGANWGDESMTFLAAIDVLIQIGGGPQSMREVEMAKAMSIPVIEYELEAYPQTVID